jgi:hypothetical protein
MRSSVAESRAAGYERLLDQVRDSPDNSKVLAAAAKMLAGCHALETDENGIVVAARPTARQRLPTH